MAGDADDHRRLGSAIPGAPRPATFARLHPEGGAPLDLASPAVRPELILETNRMPTAARAIVDGGAWAIGVAGSPHQRRAFDMHDTGPRGDGRRLFLACHDLLAGHPVSAPEGLRAAAEEILDQFDYRSNPADPPINAPCSGSRPTWAACSACDHPTRRALHCFGGLVARPGTDSPDDAPPMSVTGSGLTAREASKPAWARPSNTLHCSDRTFRGCAPPLCADIGFAPDDALLAESSNTTSAPHQGLDARPPGCRRPGWTTARRRPFPPASY